MKTAEELWLRYERQLNMYAAAMEQVTGYPVGDLIFYSTYLSEATSRPYRR